MSSDIILSEIRLDILKALIINMVKNKIEIKESDFPIFFCKNTDINNIKKYLYYLEKENIIEIRIIEYNTNFPPYWIINILDKEALILERDKNVSKIYNAIENKDKYIRYLQKYIEDMLIRMYKLDEEDRTKDIPYDRRYLRSY